MAKQGPCWDGYVQVGMKKKGKKKVPNCVPAGKKVMKAAMGSAAFSETTSQAPSTPKLEKYNEYLAVLERFDESILKYDQKHLSK